MAMWWCLLVLPFACCGVHLILQHRKCNRRDRQVQAIKSEIESMKLKSEENLRQIHEDGARSRQERSEWWTKQRTEAWRESERSL